MKILMTADAVGGVWTYALDLSAALARHDVHVVLATMGPAPDEGQRAAAGRLQNVELVESEYDLEWMPDPWSDVAKAGEWLLDLAESHAVDLVHLNGYVHAALNWSRPVLVVAHSCVYSWWLAVHGLPPPERWDGYRRRVARGLESAHCVVAPTEAFLYQLRSCYGLKAPTQVIHNGRASAFLDDDPGFHGDHGQRRQPLLFACGRVWDQAKNMRALDAIARELPWPAYVAGNAVAPDGRCKYPGSLRCIGALPPVALGRWLRRAEIFVHPSLYEPFGLSVLEAAMAGCALALADLPTLRELWDGAAEFFDPADPLDLQQCLQSLIDAPDHRRSLSAAARLRARAYRPEPMADAYADLYASLMARSHRSAVA